MEGVAVTDAGVDLARWCALVPNRPLMDWRPAMRPPCRRHINAKDKRNEPCIVSMSTCAMICSYLRQVAESSGQLALFRWTVIAGFYCPTPANCPPLEHETAAFHLPPKSDMTQKFSQFRRKLWSI